MVPTLVWHHERAVGCEAGLTNHIRDCDTGLRHIRPIGASTSALCLRLKQSVASELTSTSVQIALGCCSAAHEHRRAANRSMILASAVYDAPVDARVAKLATTLERQAIVRSSRSLLWNGGDKK